MAGKTLWRKVELLWKALIFLQHNHVTQIMVLAEKGITNSHHLLRSSPPPHPYFISLALLSLDLMVQIQLSRNRHNER